MTALTFSCLHTLHPWLHSRVQKRRGHGEGPTESAVPGKLGDIEASRCWKQVGDFKAKPGRNSPTVIMQNSCLYSVSVSLMWFLHPAFQNTIWLLNSIVLAPISASALAPKPSSSIQKLDPKPPNMETLVKEQEGQEASWLLRHVWVLPKGLEA